MIKKQAEKIHSHRRAMQRYGLNYGPRTRSMLIGLIQNDNAVFLESFSNARKSFAVYYENQWYPVIYDNKQHEIVTFLPSGYLLKYQDRLPPEP